MVWPAWTLGFVGEIVTPVTPAEGDRTPLPVRAISVGELDGLLTSDTLPVKEPAAVGAKFTLKPLL